jgi:DNA-binding IclR family transcriptional regulator
MAEERAEVETAGTVTATRVANILLAVASRERSAGVTELAQELDLSKAVVHRILRSLVASELVSSQSDGRYALGVAAARLGARAWGNFDLRLAAQEELRDLQRRTGETCTVSALAGRWRVFLDQVVSPHEIGMTVRLGHPLPLHAGATGRAILAFAPAELRDHVLAHGLPPLTDVTVTDPAELERILEEVRDSGVAVSRGERQAGASATAAPVFLGGDVVVGAVSVCGPWDRLTDPILKSYAPLLKEATARISARLGRSR